MLDACFKKWDANFNSEFALKDTANQLKRTLSKRGRATIGNSSSNPSGTTEVLSNNESADRIMAIMDQGGSPRVVIETLLDHIDSSNGGSGDVNGSANSRVVYHSSQPYDCGNDLQDRSMMEEFRSPWSHFDGLGFDESVPSYLRFNGKVLNLRMPIREVVHLLNEIWAAKIRSDEDIAERARSMKKLSEDKLLLADREEEETHPTDLSTAPPPTINTSFAAFFEFYLNDRYSMLS